MGMAAYTLALILLECLDVEPRLVLEGGLHAVAADPRRPE
jgi:hypothetical protein